MRPDPNPQQGDIGWLMDAICEPCQDNEHDWDDWDDGSKCICCGKPRQ